MPLNHYKTKENKLFFEKEWIFFIEQTHISELLDGIWLQSVNIIIIMYLYTYNRRLNNYLENLVPINNLFINYNVIELITKYMTLNEQWLSKSTKPILKPFSYKWNQNHIIFKVWKNHLVLFIINIILYF